MDAIRIYKLIQEGKLKEAEEQAIACKSALLPHEFSDLISLIHFQSGRLLKTQRSSPLLNLFTAALVSSRFLEKIAEAILNVIFGIASLLGFRKKITQTVLKSWFPPILHYAYTDFSRGLIFSFLCSVAAKRYSVLGNDIAFHRARAFYGHFLCLWGRFDRGIPILSVSCESLRTAFSNARANTRESFDPILYERVITAQVMYCLDLTWSSEAVSAQVEFDRTLQFLKKHPYVSMSVVLRSFKSLHAVEQLNDSALLENTRELQKILSPSVFESKFALRTCANAAFIAATRGKFNSAKEQLVNCDRFYEITKVPIELMAYHYTRARIDIEFGDASSAISHLNRASSFVSGLGGGLYHKVDLTLAKTEIQLLNAIIAPGADGEKRLINGIISELKRVSRKIKGAPLQSLRIQTLMSLADYVKGDHQSAMSRKAAISGRLAKFSKRLSRILDLIDTDKGTSLDLRMNHNLLDTKVEMGILEALVLLTQARTEAELQSCLGRAVGAIFGANEAQVLRRPRHNPANNPIEKRFYSEGTIGADAIRIIIPSVEDDWVCELQQPTRDPDMDLMCRNWLELVIATFLAGLTNGNTIRGLRASNDAMESNQEQILLAKLQTNVERLLVQVVHDLRSPLSAIESIARSLPESSEREILMLAHQRLFKVVEDNLARRKAVSGFQNVDLKNLLTSLKKEWTHSLAGLEASICFSSEMDGTSLNSWINESDFSRVIHNLAKNALEAQLKSSHPVLNIEVTVESSDYLSLAFIDGGEGIPLPSAAAIMAGGYTTKGTGNGLGISGSIGIMNKMFGKLSLKEVDQKPGLFPHIVIPRVNSKGSKTISKLELNENSSVFAFDDDPTILKSLQTLLSSKVSIDFKPTLVDPGFRIDSLPKIGPRDLCIVDYNLSIPDYSGIDIIRHLIDKKISSPGNIVIFTGFWDSPGLQSFSRSTGVAILKKPIESNLRIDVVANKSIPVMEYL